MLAGGLPAEQCFDDAAAKKIIEDVASTFTNVVCAHADEVGVAVKTARNREQEFNAYCEAKWPGRTMLAVADYLVDRNAELLEREPFHFALAWLAEMPNPPSRRMVWYGRFHLNEYLTKFPSGEHRALAQDLDERRLD